MKSPDSRNVNESVDSNLLHSDYNEGCTLFNHHGSLHRIPESWTFPVGSVFNIICHWFLVNKNNLIPSLQNLDFLDFKGFMKESD